MAEGDSIHRLARRLDGQLQGRVVVSQEWRIRMSGPGTLAGLAFSEVVPKGKHLLMRLSGPLGSTAAPSTLTVHSHLKMQGSWTLLGPAKHLPRHREDDVRVKLHLDNGSTLVALNMPVLDVVETRSEHEVIGHLGPDILASDFTLEEGASRLLAAGETPAVQALLNQRLVCGIGNLWAVEVLFLRGLYPWTPIGEVNGTGLLRLARRMMLYSLNNHAGMITTGDTRRGETHWVYGRFRRPCRRCGTPVEFREGGSGPYDREVWWCPHCQPQSVQAQ